MESLNVYEVDLLVRKVYYEEKDFVKLKKLIETYEIRDELSFAILHTAFKQRQWEVIELFQPLLNERYPLHSLIFTMNPLMEDVKHLEDTFGELCMNDYCAILYNFIHYDIPRVDCEKILPHVTPEGFTKFLDDNRLSLSPMYIMQKYGADVCFSILTEECHCDNILREDKERTNYEELFKFLKTVKDFYGEGLINRILDYSLVATVTNLAFLRALVDVGGKNETSPDMDEYRNCTDDEEIHNFLRKLIH